ncbi:MAG TPA: hypothetical protein VGO43_11910 [Pyrinomonadaceae bacterium]|nr:hypothetical protein [Pyrinomonadaceae bacterium]
MFRSRQLSSIVEIGSMRTDLTHPLAEVDARCCGDGHSSLYWAMETDDFVTVDVHFAAAITAGKAIKRVLGKFVTVVCMDGIEFLSLYDKPIDLLFLDAWDAYLPMSAERHLEAFEAAERQLHPRSLVLIDDTDINFNADGTVEDAEAGLPGGKGSVLVPYMLAHEWTVLFGGRQTMLALSPTEHEIRLAAKALHDGLENVREQII